MSTIATACGENSVFAACVLLSLAVYSDVTVCCSIQFVQCTSEEAFVKPHCYYEKEGNGFLPISPCPETVQAYPGRWLSHVR